MDEERGLEISLNGRQRGLWDGELLVHPGRDHTLFSQLLPRPFLLVNSY